ncbi:glutamine synthetase [Filimonas sp.]|nr:glutamine synthetase [Filimonas sp.]
MQFPLYIGLFTGFNHLFHQFAHPLIWVEISSMMSIVLYKKPVSIRFPSILSHCRPMYFDIVSLPARLCCWLNTPSNGLRSVLLHIFFEHDFVTRFGFDMREDTQILKQDFSFSLYRTPPGTWCILEIIQSARGRFISPGFAVIIASKQISLLR